MNDLKDTVAETPERPAAGSAGRAPSARPMTRGGLAAVLALSVVLVGIIGVAFRGSWTAHSEAARAVHFDATGAALYPFAPDGLILIALIAAMVLRHDRTARLYALTVVAVFTVTSFTVNHLHGLGMFTPERLAGPDGAVPWPVVALIAAQLIGAIFFGSHLIVSAWRYLFPSPPSEQAGHAAAYRLEVPVREAASAPRTELEQADGLTVAPGGPDPHEVARLVYGAALDLGLKVGRDRLAKVCQISSRQAGRIRSDVEADREEAAAREAEEAATSAGEQPGDPEVHRVEETLGLTPFTGEASGPSALASVNGSTPAGGAA